MIGNFLYLYASLFNQKEVQMQLTSPISFLSIISFVLSNTASSHTYYPASSTPVEYPILRSIAYQNLVIAVVSSRAVSIAVNLTAASAVADAISAVLALGHLLGLSVGNAEIADGHDAAILAAHPHIGTLFLTAE
jgi:hypothetical protein